MKNYTKGFVPDQRNLGGKRDIELQQKNHLLALINIRPSVDNRIAPKQHVNVSHKSQKLNLRQADDFREVYEAVRRVKQLKKSAIDNQQPNTYDRKMFIKNRIPQVKDIKMQDHQRNIKSLLTRLDGVEKVYEKRAYKIKDQYSVQNSEFQPGNSQLSYDNLNLRPQTASDKGYRNNYSQQQQFRKNEQQQQYQNNNNNDEEQQQQQYNQYDEYDNQQQEIPVNDYEKFPQVMDYSEAQLFEYSPQKQDYNDDQQQQVTNQYYEQNEQLNSNHANDIDNINDQNNKSKSVLSQQSSKKGFQIPHIPLNQGDPYKDLRRILLNIVMDFNLYDKKKILELATHAKKTNPGLDKNQITDLCKNIIVSLYGQL